MSDRKRVASSVPSLNDNTPAPNKSLKLPQAGPEREAYMQEKGLLKQKVQEASVKPFFLQPHVFAVPVLKNSNPFPVSSLIGQKDKAGGSNSNCSSPLVTFGVSPSPPAPNTPFINFLRNSPDVRNHFPHQQPLTTDFKKPAAQNYYHPWFGLPSMFSTVSPVSPFSSATQASPNLSSIPPSPVANMFHHPSPLAMLPKHSYPVCNVRNNDGVRSEYTVGPNHARPGELVVDETGSNSGRATPASDSGDEDDLLDNTDLAPPNISLPVASTSSITVTSASGKQPCVVLSSNSYRGTYARTSVTSVGSAPSSVCSQDCHITGVVQERPSSGVSSMSSDSSTSTPEPLEGVKGLPPFNAMEDDVFCHVPGRLSLLSSTPKYKVTVGEVRRRLLRPECLNASILGGILRRAKSKNGGHVLRQKLESIGLSLPPGRRKATEVNLLTSLVEEEAHHLSNDFRKSCDRHFPHAELARNVARLHAGTPEVEQRINMVQATKTLVGELQSILSGPSAAPSGLRPTDANNPSPGLSHFSLITHGFGPRTIESSLSVLQTYLDDLMKVYEGKEPASTSMHHHHHHQQQQHIPMHTQTTTERPRHNSTNDYNIAMKHETVRGDHCCKC